LPIQWVYLYHNTCTTAVPGQNGFWFKQYSNWTNVISRNNIYAGTSYALESEEDVVATVDFDYDCLFTTKALPVIRWNGANYNSLANFILNVGEEPHGVTNQPVFLNPAAHDYYPPAISPLLDKAVVIPGVNDDFFGIAPDVGALEYGMEARAISTGTNGVTMDWHVGAFGNYQLQSCTNLAQGNWVDSGEPIQAERTALRLTDPSPTAAQCFYRLLHVAP
jgi:hypothetical protein